MPRARALLPLLLALSLTDCVGVYSTRPGDLRPALANVSPADRSAVWQRAVPALLDEGYVPQVMNEAAGYISARRREDLVEDTSLVGTMVTVVVMADGRVRVEVNGTGVYGSQQEFEAAISDRQQRVLRRILNEPAPSVPAAK